MPTLWSICHFVYYSQNGSKLHLVRLDASKAFDKMWSDEPFYKLLNKIPNELWRLNYNYYIILAPSYGHCQILLDLCSNFSKIWEIYFNPSKSVSSVEYLGLPIGDSEYTLFTELIPKRNLQVFTLLHFYANK
ncbi:hypothetical protein BpHYR1_025830 [Brachionus plicatilis]|uniref:Reverse transcriptase domain-containing protein n=1 Tax=Brachionus plicatilis TaxID=10195 RepID=A0A3M7PE83_BRAPC|nr:hypothetical protein BpHYR1_025830 [Brachionus plicatilis]